MDTNETRPGRSPSATPPAARRWTRETILERFRAWARTHDGHAPLATDWGYRGHADWRAGQWPSTSAVKRMFGTWTDAVAAAGVQPHPHHRRSWTRDEVVQRVEDWAATHQGEGPILSDWKAGRVNADVSSGTWPAAETALQLFDSWEQLLAAAGVTPREQHQPGGRYGWPQDLLIERLRTWSDTHGGHGPLSTDWSRQGHPDYASGDWPSAGTVRRAFGSWERALRVAGVTPGPRHLRQWARELIIRRIRDWASAHDGKGPSREDWSRGAPEPGHDRGEWPHASTVIARFGSFDAALDAAGVEHGGRRRWTRDAILERLGAWAAANDGNAPRRHDWGPDGAPDWSAGRWPGERAVVARFGSWGAALAAAGLTARPARPRRVARWTPEAVGERMRAWAAAHAGTFPRPSDWQAGGHADWRRGDWPSAASVMRAYGTWAAAIRAAAPGDRLDRAETSDE
jgi:hypothetical protein